MVNQKAKEMTPQFDPRKLNQMWKTIQVDHRRHLQRPVQGGADEKKSSLCRLDGSAKWQNMVRSEIFIVSGAVVRDVWEICLSCARELMEPQLSLRDPVGLSVFL
mmetsp:Transcript_5371/g.13500  ORF Transcript_5371/g.13500 Transcript_5371/m.13500 type:complete len:105 (-) Transcript_5371:1995-2309(-)